jgi:cytoskeleton protein RodZ
MPADRPAGDFGRKLREARERRGVSLRQIANATKISVSALEALERNNISRLPGGIFSRAFVRSYAVEVGLDPETTIQEFMAQFPHDSVTAGHPMSTEQSDDNTALESDRRMASTFLWLLLVSVPVAGGVLYFATSGRRAASDEPAAVTARTLDARSDPKTAEPPSDPSASHAPDDLQAAAPATTATPRPPASTSTAPESAPAGGGPSAAAPKPGQPGPAATAPADDKLVVGLSVRRPVWVSATVDGQKALEQLLQAGEQRTIDVRRELVLTAGDASALGMTLNGAPARALGRSGEVVTTRINMTNFKDYLQAR